MSLVPLVILSIGCSLAWVAVIFLYLRAGQVRAALLRLLDERVHSAPKATSAASSLEIIDALRYRANLLDTLTEGRLSHKISTLSVPESNRAIEDGTRDPLLGRFQNATLLTARVQMRDGSSAIVIRGQGTRGPVFERRLREFLAPYLLFGREICFGLRDQLLCDSLFEGFASFGFAYTVCLPVGRMESAPTEREVLWCGFLQGKRPNERELQYLLQLAIQRGEQQLAERVRAAESGERERVDFLAHISHDMRSPLYNVKSIVNILRLENPAPETVELLEVARTNCESLEEIIGDVLDLTRHGVGKLRASPEIFDLGACVAQVVEAFAVSARAKGLRLQCRLHEDRLAVCGDRRHLRRAISNILSNAIKYTPTGVVLVELRRDADGSPVLTIKDSGRGMSKVELAQLFKPFTRFQSEGIEGVGLGLAITKILVELSGGHIEVRSQEGKGSEFFLRFGRVTMQPEAPELANTSLPDGGRVNLEGMSVLLVDDDAGCVESLARLLGRSGCRLRKCYSVGEAINLISFDAPDCIISDAQMPGGGVELLLKAIRERPLECSLLILSGNDDLERVEGWLARGADRVLVKPATVSDIESWLYEVRKSQNETFSSQEVPLQQARG